MACLVEVISHEVHCTRGDQSRVRVHAHHVVELGSFGNLDEPLEERSQALRAGLTCQVLDKKAHRFVLNVAEPLVGPLIALDHFKALVGHESQHRETFRIPLL